MDASELSSVHTAQVPRRTTAFGRWDYIYINIYGFGLTGFWGALHMVVLPILILGFAPETRKNTYLGLLTVAGLLLAMLLQPVVGALSDGTASRWGSRRPYIVLGTVLALLLLPWLGWSSSLIWLLLVYCALQTATNIAQSPYQAYLRDLAPDTRRGTASGMKGLVEMLGGGAMIGAVGLMMTGYEDPQGKTWLWASLALMGATLTTTLAVTLARVREAPPRVPRPEVQHTSSHSSDITIPTFRIYLLSRFLVTASIAIAPAYAFYFIRDVVAPESASRAIAVLAVVGVLGLVASVGPAGALSDRLGRKPILMAAGVLGLAGTGFLLLFARDLPMIALAGLLSSVAAGMFLSSNWAMGNDLAPGKAAARYLALANGASVAGALAARLAGPAVDALNHQRNGLGYYSVLAAAVAFIALGSLLALKVKNGRAAPSLKQAMP